MHRCKSAFLAAAAMVCLTIGTWAQAGASKATVAFDFKRLSGLASNQFAVWVEDASGAYVKTLFVTGFTAKKGWKTRPEALPQWVKAAGAPTLSGAELDAISGPTPKSSKPRYSWEFTDKSGTRVPDGEYAIVVEASLRWANRLVATRKVRVGGPPSPGPFELVYFGDETKDREMIAAITLE